MNTPTVREYTVVDAIDSQMGASSMSLRQALEGIGLDPDMPVAVLRALLAQHNTPTPDPLRSDHAIAERARTAAQKTTATADPYINALREGWNRAVDWIRDADEPDSPTLTPLDVELAHQYSDMAQRLDPAVPVQEPTCTTCGDTKEVPCKDAHCPFDNCRPCPVCVVELPCGE